MYTIKHISYSALKLWESDRRAYFLRYLASKRKPYDPQTHYMAVGSAFDAFVKAELHKRYINDGDPTYDRDTLFEDQVEPHVRDEARTAGEAVWKAYQDSGAFDALCSDLDGADTIRMEVEVTADLGDCTILGLPDLMFVNRLGKRVIHDWKVNGYYSKNGPPKPRKNHYVIYEPGATPRKFNVVNLPFNNGCPDWAEQLTMYAWVMDAPDCKLQVDQCLFPRFVRYQGEVEQSFKDDLRKRLANLWSCVKSGHVFTDLPFEENLALCKTLEAQAGVQVTDDFAAMTSTGRKW